MRANPIELKQYTPEWDAVPPRRCLHVRDALCREAVSTARIFCEGGDDEHLPANRTR